MQEFKSQKIKSVLKDLLKKKGLTYETLAEQMECSVPTIKRILGPEELSLNRLLQLCEIVEIDLAELDTLTREQNTSDERYSDEQENFLAKNRNHFAYLMRLFQGESPRHIADAYDLTARSTDKYLIALEKHGLIRVTGKQKVKPAFKRPPILGNGPLAKAFFEAFIRESGEFYIRHIHEQMLLNRKESGPPMRFRMVNSKVSSESYEAFVKELEKLTDDFEKRAAFEEKTKPAAELKTAVVIDAHTLVESDYPGLKRLESTFGEIVNI